MDKNCGIPISGDLVPIKNGKYKIGKNNHRFKTVSVSNSVQIGKSDSEQSMLSLQPNPNYPGNPEQLYYTQPGSTNPVFLPFTENGFIGPTGPTGPTGDTGADG